MSTRTEPIQLTEIESGQEVEGVLLHDPSYTEIRDLDIYWRDYVHVSVPEFKMRGVSEESVPDYVIWKWAAKMSLAKRESWRFFCITHRQRVQGAIVISIKPAACKASIHRGKLGLGIELLAAAPWNIGRFMRSIKRSPYLDFIGPTLMQVAISLSQATPECEGRLYLYSVPKAERFYRVNCGMIALDTEFHRDEELRRFEMTKEQAAEFLEGGEA